ncbi:MAG: polysaccharide pyruvyl transferase family protein [Anaerolineaceae bacterium]|nr:polysaccharide pyruvyl transferase family protein [Anaerolineaceae bacterium]
MINIGVMGYYGYGNLGDEVILENLQGFLSPHRVIPMPLGLTKSPDLIRRLNALDFLILGGGGLYRKAPPSPFGVFGDWGDAVTTPIGVLGLGVEKLAPHHMSATHQLIDKSSFFFVRDEESQRILGHPRVQVAPDLTFYNPIKALMTGSSGEEVVCGVNLRPSHDAVANWRHALLDLPVTKKVFPFSIHPELGDREALLELDPNCPDEFNLNNFAAVDIVVGAAFHSIVFAIQLGIPVIAINYDPKVYRLMHEIGLSQYMLEWHEWDRLRSCYEQALTEREVIRQRMNVYTSTAQVRLHKALEEPRQVIEAMARQQFTITQPTKTKPKVSIIIRDNNADDALKRTLSSCLRQTHNNLELLILTARAEDELPLAQITGDLLVHLLPLPEDAEDWVTAGLSTASGDYITWLEAGCWFTDDALALLVATLMEKLAVDAVHTSFFLTQGGIIERKVRLDKGQKPDKACFLGPCLLVRRHKAADVWRQIKSNSTRGQLRGMTTRYVQSALFFLPCQPWESSLHRSLIAFRRGEIDKAKHLFTDALTSGRQNWAEAVDLVDLLATTARRTTIPPYEFTELIFDNLPPGAEEFAVLKKRVLARITILYCFENQNQMSGFAMFSALFKGIRYDFSWLSNHGVQVLFLRALRKTIIQVRE